MVRLDLLTIVFQCYSIKFHTQSWTLWNRQNPILKSNIFNYKIITRYLEHDEAAWADEVSVILFIWIIFWANAFLVRDKEQITFDLVYRQAPDGVKRWMALTRLVLIGGIFLWALPGSVDYLLFLWRERTPVLNLRLDVIYSCFGLFLATVIVRAAGTIVKLIGPKWRGSI